MPDYWSDQNVVEIKEIAEERFKSFQAVYGQRIGDRPHVGIPGIKNAWLVTVNAGDYPEIPGQFRQPRLAGLAERLSPLLLELEARGIAHPSAAPELWYPIRAMLGGGLCEALPNGETPPGIHFMGWGIGHSRPTDMNRVVVDTVQNWLTGAQASNVLASLWEDRLHRVAALTCATAGAGLAIWQSLDRDFPDVEVVPTQPLMTPDGIDSVVVVAGNHTLRYCPSAPSGEAAWSRKHYADVNTHSPKSRSE